MHLLRYCLSVGFAALWHCCAAQNRINDQGLKYGHWDVGDVECSYRILPFSFFDTVAFDGDGKLTVRVFNGRDTTTESVRIAGYFGDSVSVLDGIFKTRDSVRNIVEIVEYRCGLYGSNISFVHGDTLRYNHSFAHIDSNFYDDYIGNRPFRRMYFEDRSLKYAFYPYSDLVISNALRAATVDLNKSPVDTATVFVTARTEQYIYNVTHHPGVRVFYNNFEPVRLPQAICPGDTLWLRLVSTQYPYALRPEDTVRISTADARYDIYLGTTASHLSARNMSELKSLSLSRTRDRYLVVNSCGPYGHMAIKGTEGWQKDYDFQGENLYLIDLYAMPAGRYEIGIRMCYDDDAGQSASVALDLTE